jgi:hypothetical protein
MKEKIKQWIHRKIIKLFYKSEIRKYCKSIRNDEDCYGYLLDLLQEDERRMFISREKDYYQLDIFYNREMQEQIKELIKNYGNN